MSFFVLSKLPSEPDMQDSPNGETTINPAYTDYMVPYGAFIAVWMFYEQVVELLLKSELRLDFRETSILCSAINFGVKLNTLKALMRRDPTKLVGVGLLSAVQSIAARNNIVHGFLAFEDEKGGDRTIKLVTRDVKDGKYTVKSKTHDPGAHIHQFIQALRKVQEWSGITDDDIDAYGQLVKSEARVDPNPESNHP
jgi:hypothetical protein